MIETLGVYAMLDTVAATFLTPTFESSEAVALRNFRFAIESTPFLHSNAADYNLYRLANFNPVTGEFESLSPIQLLARGADFVSKE